MWAWLEKLLGMFTGKAGGGATQIGYANQNVSGGGYAAQGDINITHNNAPPIQPPPEPRLVSKAKVILLMVDRTRGKTASFWTAADGFKRMQIDGRLVYSEGTDPAIVNQWLVAFCELLPLLQQDGSTYHLKNDGQDLATRIRKNEPELDLSFESLQILRETLSDKHNMVDVYTTTGGYTISSNGKTLICSHDGLAVRPWQSAVSQLLKLGAIQDDGSHKVFKVTQRGRDILVPYI